MSRESIDLFQSIDSMTAGQSYEVEEPKYLHLHLLYCIQCGAPDVLQVVSSI